MFSIDCAYQPTAYGVIFLPPEADSDYKATLRVEFEFIVRMRRRGDIDVPEYRYDIGYIQMIDHRDCATWYGRDDKIRIRDLKDEAFVNAKAFLRRYCGDAMHKQASAETASAFGGHFGSAA